MAASYRLTTEELLPALSAHGIRLLTFADLTETQRASLRAFFTDAVLPVLTPLAIDVSRPFPLLSSLSINVAVLLDAEPGDADHRLAIVQVPIGLTRLVKISTADGVAFVLLEEIIRAHLPQLFPGQPILEASIVRLSRDAELELDDEGGRTHLERVEREVRRRRRSGVVRLEVDGLASDELLAVLCRTLDIPADAVYSVPGPVDLRVLMGLAEVPGFEALRDPPLQPVDVLAGNSGICSGARRARRAAAPPLRGL